MTLVRKPEDQISPTPRNMKEWAMERAKNRGLSSREIPRAKLNVPMLFPNARARIFKRQEKRGS
jgi:hypothetical protein